MNAERHGARTRLVPASQNLTTARDRAMMVAGIVMATAIFLTDLAQ